jgi:hypothetical protein
MAADDSHLCMWSGGRRSVPVVRGSPTNARCQTSLPQVGGKSGCRPQMEGFIGQLLSSTARGDWKWQSEALHLHDVPSLASSRVQSPDLHGKEELNTHPSHRHRWRGAGYGVPLPRRFGHLARLRLHIAVAFRCTPRAPLNSPSSKKQTSASPNTRIRIGGLTAYKQNPV